MTQVNSIEDQGVTARAAAMRLPWPISPAGAHTLRAAAHAPQAAFSGAFVEAALIPAHRWNCRRFDRVPLPEPDRARAAGDARQAPAPATLAATAADWADFLGVVRGA